jgi:methylenetetrahydrofolate reductase (NADPH)
MASNKDGSDASASPNASSVSAVSWGVFPGSEIVEPYVADLASFKLWAEEAFALWTAEFGAAFEEVPAVLKEVQSSWVLVSVLSHDYISSDAIKVLGA